MQRPDGLSAHLRTLGWDCVDVDVVNASLPGQSSEDHDLNNISLWDRCAADLSSGRYAGVFMGTPCETASRARTGPPGPRPLRSPEHLYGLPRSQLSPEEYDQVSWGTFYALKSAEIAQRASELGVPWGIENPDPRDNPVSLFNLPEWQALLTLPGAQVIDFHQCPMGAETAKPTRVLHVGLDLSSLSGTCSHPKQWWNYTDHQGRQRHKFGAHPPLVGRRRADGAMATKDAAAYPGEMNLRLATAFTRTASAQAPQPPLQGPADPPPPPEPVD